jgi:hypothetical protein
MQTAFMTGVSRAFKTSPNFPGKFSTRSNQWHVQRRNVTYFPLIPIPMQLIKFNSIRQQSLAKNDTGGHRPFEG